MRTLTSSAVTIFLICAGCNQHGVRGSGTATSEQRTLGGFNSVEISGAFAVTIQCGESPRASVSGDDNIVPLVKTDVRGSRLLVYTEQDIDPRTELSVDIMTPRIQSVSASGTSSVDIRKVQGEQLTIVLSGAGKIKANGSVHYANIVATGAGEISTRDLHATTLGITMSGAGKADVFATDTLDVTIAGAGSVNYYGDPKEVKKSITGVGFVTKK